MVGISPAHSGDVLKLSRQSDVSAFSNATGRAPSAWARLRGGRALLLNDDGIVYPHPWPTTGFRKIGYLTWSPDDKRVSFREMDFPSYDSYVVLVSPHGEVVREDLPVDVEYNSQVNWTDDSHLEITTSERTFRFELRDQALHESRDAVR